MKLGVQTIVVGETTYRASGPNPADVYEGTVTEPILQLTAGDLDAGFLDVSGDMLEWAYFGETLLALNVSGMRDFMALAAVIEPLVTAIAGADYSSWSALTEDQKLVACRFLTPKVPLADFAARILVDDRKPLVKSYIDKARASWAARMEAAEGIIFSSMPFDARHQLLAATNEQIDLYLKAGITSVADSGTDGIIDYLQSTGRFEGAGFAESGFAVNPGQTLGGIATAVIAALNGNY